MQCVCVGGVCHVCVGVGAWRLEESSRHHGARITGDYEPPAVGPGTQNSGPHASAKSILIAEPSLQTQLTLF